MITPTYSTVLLSLLIFAGIVRAADKPTCAVMTFQPLSGVTEGQARLVSERMFNEIGKADRFRMIERGQAEQVLKENQIAVVCADTSSAIEAGKILAAQRIVIGNVGKIGELYTIHSRLVSVESGVVETMATIDHEGRLEDLLRIAAVNTARQLLGLPLISGPEFSRPPAPLTNEATLMGAAVSNLPLAKPGKAFALDLGNGVKLDLAWIPDGELVSTSDGSTTRRIIPIQGFWMGATEVTQEQWQEIMGNNPSRFNHPRNPVENATWQEANDFCRKVEAIGNARSTNSAPIKVRLPTSTEWEYACWAGVNTPYNTGNTVVEFSQAAWFADNSTGRTHPVAGKNPNRWGLYDMHGNVWEWCDNPIQSWGKQYLIKGGSYEDSLSDFKRQQSDDRRPSCKSETLGFRVLVAP